MQSLPYADDIRANPAAAPATPRDAAAEQQLAAAMQQLLGAFRLPADFEHHRQVNSPAVQKYFSVLQAVALMEGSADSLDNMRPAATVLQSAAVQQQAAKIRALTGLTDAAEAEAPKVSSRASRRDAAAAAAAAAVIIIYL